MAEEQERDDELIELLREIRTYLRFTTSWTFVTAVALVAVALGVVQVEVHVP